jgi:hypothetical protein
MTRKISALKQMFEAYAAMTCSAFIPAAKAEQVNMLNEAADLNGDGIVTMVELRLYNMGQRGG